MQNEARLKVRRFLVENRRGLSILLHTTLITTAYVAAYLLRFDGQLSPSNWLIIGQTLPLIVLIKLARILHEQRDKVWQGPQRMSNAYSGVWKWLNGHF